MTRFSKAIRFSLMLLPSALLGGDPVGSIFLLTSPSPAMNGMGQLGTAFSTKDLYSVYYNPANFRSLPEGSSLAFSPRSETPWLRSLTSDLFFRYTAASLGYKSISCPLELNLGVYQTYFDLGPVATDSFGEPVDSPDHYMAVNAVSIGSRANFTWRRLSLNISAGVAGKEAVISHPYPPEDGPKKARNIFFDLGVLVATPLALVDFPFWVSLRLTPAVGYGVLNLSDDIEYPWFSQTDPPPTTARLGFSLSLELVDRKSGFSIGTWRYGREVEDILVRVRVEEGEPYPRMVGWYLDGPLGDIDILRHLIQDEPDEKVIIHRGEEVTLLGSYSLRVGEYVNLDGLEFQTRGKSFYAHPFFLVLHLLFPSPLTSTLARHVDLSYSQSIEKGSIRNGTKYQNVTLTLNHLDELIATLWPKK